MVDCPEDVQVARVMRRSGLEERQVRPSWPPRRAVAELAAADDVIDNRRQPELCAQVERLHGAYLRAGVEGGVHDMIRADRARARQFSTILIQARVITYEYPLNEDPHASV